MDQSAVLKARNPSLNYQPGRLIIVDTPPPRAPTSPASQSPTRAITRAHVKALNCGPCKTRIAEPAPANGNLLWRGDEAARKVVSANRARLRSGARRETMRRRGELVERSFAHILDCGCMRRAWLREHENVHKRYPIRFAGFPSAS